MEWIELGAAILVFSIIVALIYRYIDNYFNYITFYTVLYKPYASKEFNYSPWVYTELGKATKYVKPEVGQIIILPDNLKVKVESIEKDGCNTIIKVAAI